MTYGAFVRVAAPHGDPVGEMEAPTLLVHQAMMRPAQRDQVIHPGGTGFFRHIRGLELPSKGAVSPESKERKWVHCR